MKRLSGELRNASKTHLAQSVRVKAHYDEMRKKVSDEVFRKLYTQFHGILNVYGDLENASKTHLEQAKKLDAFIKLKEFSESFKQADTVILCPVYAAGEKIKLGFNYYNFAKEIIKKSKVKLFMVNNQYQLAKFIKNNVHGKKIVIGMGAGTISTWMKELPKLI